MAHQNTIFISYARKDSTFVLRLTKDLQDAGVDVWLDKRSIDPGEDWDAAIEEAMETSSSLLIVLSPNSVGSRNVMDEVSYALEEGKRVLPVLYRPCDVPFRLRRVQRSDFTASYEEGKADLMDVLGKPFEPPKPAPAWQKSLRQVPRQVWKGVAVVVGVAMLIAFLVYSLGLQSKRVALMADISDLEGARAILTDQVDDLKGEIRKLNGQLGQWEDIFEASNPNETFHAKIARLKDRRVSYDDNFINPAHNVDPSKREANQLIQEILVMLDKCHGCSKNPKGDPEETLKALEKYNGPHDSTPSGGFYHFTEEKMEDDYERQKEANSSNIASSEVASSEVTSSEVTSSELAQQFQ